MERKDREFIIDTRKLLEDLKSSDQEVQLNAVRIAGEQQVVQAVSALVDLLKSIVDPYESQTRHLLETAIWALGEIGDTKAIPALIDMLHNAFYKVQTSAISALGKMAAEEAVSPIWEIAQSFSSPDFVRITAIEAMGQIATQDAREHLQEFAESMQIPKPLQEKATQALHSIQGFW